MRKNIPIPVDFMVKNKICSYCGFSNHRFVKKQPLRCNYQDTKALNYLNIPDGICALTKEELQRITENAKHDVKKFVKKMLRQL